MYNAFANRLRRNRKGFTLIELLVVVLILAILMAVALPLYLSSVADAQKKTCRANMQTIANAVQARYVQNNGAGGYAAVSGTVNAAFCGPGNTLPDLQAPPVCPTGGVYSVAVGDGALKSDSGTVVPATQFLVECTLHGNFAPGIDSK